MKKNVFLLAMILVLSLFLQSSAYAALTPYYGVSNNLIRENNGNFYYPNMLPFPSSVANTVVGTGSATSQTSYSDNLEMAWGQPTYHSGANFSGTATVESGVSDGGVYASGYTIMTYEGFTGGPLDTPGVDGVQKLTAQYTQYYTDPDADPNGTTMQITGSLDFGEINFNEYTSGLFSSDYTISATVTVNEDSFTGGTGVNNLVWMNLDADNPIETALVTIQPGSLSGSGFNYAVTTTLIIEALLDNVEVVPPFTVNTESIDGTFAIGNIDSPVVATAMWSEVAVVPVPSSLLLILSGIAGLSFIKRRRS